MLDINRTILGIWLFFLWKKYSILFNVSYKQFYYKIGWYCINGILFKFGYIFKNSEKVQIF